MAHQSLYRRYRPARFGEIIGQPHTVAALRNAVAEDRVGHAYLFSGPRGTGKTSTARILAKALNCEDLAEGEPCGTCGFCTSIAAGTSYELHELDAASNNKVDDIRDLISRVAIGTPGRTKVYVLDEVHMLTPGAENALLKTLEEPPGHVVFVLCTTEPHKVVQTIRSRTQHLHFALVGADLLERHVRAVASDAGLDVADDDVRYVLAAGGGSVRDTLSALDAVTAAGRAPEGGDAVAAVLDALVAGDTAAALAAADEATRGGQEPRVLGEALLGQLRNAFLASVEAPLEHLSAADRAVAAERARHMSSRALTSAMELLGTALVGMREAPDPRVDLDLALVRLTGEDSRLSLRSLADRVERLEQGIAGRPQPASTATGSAERSSAAAGSPTGRRPSGGQPPPAGGGPSGPARARQALAETSETPKLAPAPAAESPDAVSAPSAATPTATAPEAVPRPAEPSAATAEPAREAAPTAPVGADHSQASPSPAAADESLRASPALPSGATVAPVPVPAPAPPSRDEAVLAWAQEVLPTLDKAARARLAAGRFLPNADDSLRIGFSTPGYLQRCADYCPEVEASFGRYFGRVVRVLFVLDDGSRTAPPAAAAGEGALRSPLLGEVCSSAARVASKPARREALSGVEEVQQAFPGSRLIQLETS